MILSYILPISQL